MSNDGSLFVTEEYCIDTNAILAFMRDEDDEPYGRAEFEPQWQLIEKLITEGRIVATDQVRVELEHWEQRIPDMKSWLANHRHMFRGATDESLAYAKSVVNEYAAYGSSANYLADLEVISLAGCSGLVVITLEQVRHQFSPRSPKIPEICERRSIECLSVRGFLRREQQK